MSEIKEQLLKVQWLDARYGDGWISEREIKEVTGYRLENIGYGFIKDNGDVVMCTQKDLEDGEYRRYWLIPKDYIVSMEELVGREKIDIERR